MGVCVRDTDPECPRSGPGSIGGGSSNNDNISCRPGLRGIVAEALYCPEIPSSTATEVRCPETAEIARPALRPPLLPNKPTLLEVLLSGGNGSTE